MLGQHCRISESVSYKLKMLERTEKCAECQLMQLDMHSTEKPTSTEGS